MLTNKNQRLLTRIREKLRFTRSNARTPIDWVNLQRVSGASFPSDYQLFIDEFGPGKFGEFVIFDPQELADDFGGTNDERLAQLVLSDCVTNGWSNCLRPMSSGNGLLAIGADRNGGTFSYAFEGERANVSIVYGGRDWTVAHTFFCSFSQLMLLIMNGNYVPDSMVGSEYWIPSESSVYDYVTV